MISGGVVGWEKAEDVPCSCLCIMSLYFAYKMIMQGRDAPARYERVASMAPASSSIFTAAIYFSRRFLDVCKSRTKTSRLTVCPTWIGILWRWTSMLTNLAGHGECRLVLFHAIRNFLANEIYHFSRLSHQTMFFLGQLAPYNQLLIQPLYRS